MLREPERFATLTDPESQEASPATCAHPVQQRRNMDCCLSSKTKRHGAKIFRFPGGEQAWRTVLSARPPGGGLKKRKFLPLMSNTCLETLWAEACFPSRESGSPGCSSRFRARSHCCWCCSTVPLSAHKPPCHPYTRLGEAKFAKTADVLMQFRDKCKRVARGLLHRRTEDYWGPASASVMGRLLPGHLIGLPFSILLDTAGSLSRTAGPLPAESQTDTKGPARVGGEAAALPVVAARSLPAD